MKQSRFIQLIFVLFCTVSCANHQSSVDANNDTLNNIASLNTEQFRDTFAIGKIIPIVVCKNDPAKSYALYIPSGSNNHPLPVIYFFDPHAGGALPLTKYKELADKYGFILIGSNNSKNGNDYAVTENIWNTISADVLKRILIDSSRIYACGFSGGAKAAGYIALNHSEVKGIIANSAALPDGTAPGNFNFSFTGIAGTGDMNMTDVVDFCNDLDKTTTYHRLLLFDGKHEWAPETSMSTAFEGLLLDAMRSKQIRFDSLFIKTYITESEKKVSEYVAQNNFIKAGDECKLSINMLNGLTADVSIFIMKDASIKTNPSFQKQLQQQQQLFATEESMKAVYQQQFQTGDINYWTTTIKDLNTKAKAKTNEGAMFNRLLAYLSLAFYSISNHLIIDNQNNEAQYFVGLYKMDDPANSDAWYFSAILDARKNDSRATENDLIKAAENGFSDKERMLHQTDFQSLSTPINFSEVESQMK